MTRNVTLVTGPPCGGKTTWVRQHASPGDHIVDHDLIATRVLGSPRAWRHPKGIRDQAEQIVHQHINAIAQADDITAWIIRCAPEPRRREALASLLRAEVHVIDPGLAECLRRAAADQRPPGTAHAIRQWYARAQRR